MKLEQSFEVAAPLDRVWAALIDVERVAPCLPGADISGRNEDGSYNGTFRVKIGPTAAAYVGKLEMEKIDDIGHTAIMQAQGTDRRGQGGAKATILSAVKEAGPGATLVEVITEYHITGRLARFGRGGMIEDISNRLLREFAEALQELLAAPAEEGAYETFIGISAVTAEAAAGEAPPQSPAAESRTAEPPAEEKPKRRPRRDLAAAADAVAAASQPTAAGEPESVAPEPVAPEPVAPEPVAPEPEAEAVAAAAEDELAAVVPKASGDSEPPAEEAPAPPEPEPVPPEPEPAPPEPEPEPVPPEPQPVPPEPEPAPPPTPEPPPPPPPAPEPPPPPPTPEPPPPEPPPPPPPPPPEPPPPPAAEGEPLDGLTLARTAIVDVLRRNPAPLVALLLAFLLLRRRRRRRG
ncbi:MAG: SRPBCC family protein [Solirubrobacteraceae bacterium]